MDKTFKEKLDILPIKNIEHPVGDTKYYAAVHVKTLIAQADEEIANLKSQLQQQALPVVPECVDKTVELLKKNPESSWSKLYSSLGEEGVTWLNEFQHKDERFGFGGLNSKLFVLFHLAINGYTEEKPQLFYLKNKMTGDCLAICLARASSGLYVEVTEKWLTRKEQTSYKLYFTQQEIDSMQTGSYEQIEVTECSQ
ncbi:DUF1642 domain-containing protein [Lactococcus lactis]|uniref:DUF1642 domain-containing protein n=1 Tax=Lactococcus lactis subsp. lactis TaxID=1360 RepID=A0A0V8E3D8_LACLL|nr:DUF1642 domain-containing protein [Lactococcus lactis]KSU20185.1 hypothetical protein M20_1619 [Lactococcus lactis subsp. lactis]